MYNNFGRNVTISKILKLGAEFQIVEVSSGEVGIWHKECDMISYNDNDILERYCANCHKYLV